MTSSTDLVAPLHGLRVVDLTRVVAGPFATQVLSDLGADVVRVVSPTGASSAPPSVELTAAEAFEWGLNRNKRTVAIDLRDAGDRAKFDRLVAAADVVVENFRPGVMRRLGLDHERLATMNERIVTCSIYGFGHDGPWAGVPAYDAIVQAMSGAMHVTGGGSPDEPPCRWGVPIGDIAGSLYAVIGILGALHARDRDGAGQSVSVSLFDAQLALSSYRVPQAFDAGVDIVADPHRGGAGTTPYGPFRCAGGGWLAIGVAQQHWPRACAIWGAPELEHDERFASEPARQMNASELLAIVSELFTHRDADEWEREFVSAGVPAGCVNTIRQALDHPNVVARGMIQRIDDHRGRRASVAGDPTGLSDRVAHDAPGSPVVVNSIEWTANEPDSQSSAESSRPNSRRPPLEGTRIIEFDGDEPSKALATQILADLGADVVLVERPKAVRRAAPGESFTGADGVRWGLHRAKRSVGLDLKANGSDETVRALVDDADVVYDNYRPGILARLGIDFDALAESNPGLVMCSVTGFGHRGPWSTAPAYDVTIQALGGSMSITGNGGPDDPPVRWGHPVGGLAGALYGAIAVLASLRQARQTGTGRRIDLSLLDVQVALHCYRVPQALNLGFDFRPQPHEGGSGARPYGPFQTADERWFVVAITSQFWHPFCEVVGLDELVDDPKFATEPDRQRHAKELDAVVAERFVTKDVAAWERLFHEHSVPGGMLRTLEEAFSTPAATASNMLVRVDCPEGGFVHVPGFPIRLGRSEVGAWRPAPARGEHTDHVLRAVANTAGTIEARHSEQVGR